MTKENPTLQKPIPNSIIELIYGSEKLMGILVGCQIASTKYPTAYVLLDSITDAYSVIDARHLITSSIFPYEVSVIFNALYKVAVERTDESVERAIRSISKL